MVAKALGLEIFFVIDDTYEVSDMSTLNSTRKNWTIPEFINHFAVLGNLHYKNVQAMAKENSCSLLDILQAIGFYGGEYSEQIKKGLLRFNYDEKREKAKWKIKFFNDFVALVKSRVPGNKSFLTQWAFKTAMFSFMNRGDFSEEVFLNKVDKNINCLSNRYGRHQYEELFKDIFNIKNRNPMK